MSRALYFWGIDRGGYSGGQRDSRFTGEAVKKKKTRGVVLL